MVRQQSGLILQSLDSDANSVAIVHALSGIKYFAMVWRFYFGIYFQESRKCGKRPDMKLIGQHMLGLQGFNDELLLWHCAFEAKNKIIIDEAIGLLMNSYSNVDATSIAILTRGINFGEPNTAHDCAAILYVIANIQECGKMKLDFGNCGIRENQINELADILASKDGTRENLIKTLSLSGSNLTDRSICGLFHRASSAFQSLAKLNLSDNKIGVESINSIATSLAQSYSSQLSSLNLSHNPLKVSGLLALEEVIRDNLLSNLEYLYLKGSFTNDVDINGAVLTTLIDALIAHCPMLCLLDLSQNYLGVSGISAVGVTISELSKSYCHQKLSRLSLSRCQLTLSECDHQSSDNFLCEETFRDVEQRLCQMFPNHTIIRLDLQENNFNGERILILSSLMVLCSHLKYLSSSHCHIDSDDLKKLLNQLNERKSSFPSLCSQLSSWNLDHNQLDDGGVSVLLDHLPSLFPQLGVDSMAIMYKGMSIMRNGITLQNNSISSEMAVRVKEEMQKYKEDKSGIQIMQSHPIGSSLPMVLADTGSSIEKEVGDFQTQWEVIVSLLYQTVLQEVLPNCPSIQLVVVQEEEESLCASNSSLGNDSICIQELSDPVHSDHEPFGKSPIRNAQTNTESTAQDDRDGSIPTLSMSLPHTMRPPAGHSETVAESQKTHNGSDIIVTSQLDEVSTSHSNDNEELKKTDVDQPLLVETDEDAKIEKVTTAAPFLTVDDLASVQRAVWEGRAKWYNIGLELGLTAGTLDAIQQTNHDHTDHCFRATLKEWLSRADLYPSWCSLASSLRALPVGSRHLAEHLMANLDANKSCSDKL